MVAGGGIGMVVLALVAYMLGFDPGAAVEMATPAEGPAAVTEGPPQDELGQFVSVVLADTEDTWNELFRGAGRAYEEPELVLFSGAVQSQCGVGQAAMGPFYCPADRRVYIDLAFYRELRDRFQAPGDFAQAYVIAHEVGHHVQNVRGTNAEVRRQQEQNPDEANELSVKLELQADCYAGVWAHSVLEEGDLEEGDVEEGLAAAEAVGDDRLQKQAGAQVNPESWTHGSSEQRMEWFQTGFKSGEPDRCDTFS
jgi:hypothetical protein